MSNTEQNKIIERLEFLSDCVTKGRESIDRNFHMSIPARPLEDADLVLSTAGCMIRYSYAEISALRDEVARLNNRITEMSELCLTVQEVNKIKADTIRDAAEKCKSIIRVDDDMLEICYPYTLKAHADKVESGI
jgi:hypothetical protein